jgi:hypothetical protein
MKVQYLFSSSQGDRSVSEEELDAPLHISLSETHPALTLRDYFESIEDLFLKENTLTQVARSSGAPLRRETISLLEIRCEKVGTLYHVASVTLQSTTKPIRFAVATAITDEAMRCMEKEVDHLRFLTESYRLSSLPKVFLFKKLTRPTPQGDFPLSHLVQEWFEDYHEWHLTRNKAGSAEGLLIWDQQRGYRLASPREFHEIFRQAAKILTLCYDIPTFRQVYPWHHGAGDFIVRTVNQDVDVKLTTVRGYDPMLFFEETEEADPWRAFILFFLNLTIKMRLDREDGVGELLWADEPCVRATVEGLADALPVMEAEGRLHLGKAEDILALMKLFTEGELRQLVDLLLEFYRRTERASYPVIRSRLESHVRQLYLVIQALPSRCSEGAS